MTTSVRLATPDDADALWEILRPIVRAGKVFAVPQDMPREAALAFWFSPGNEVFVAEREGSVLGTYFIRPNQRGGGAHVANAGYATAEHAQGQGVARAMCAHSLDRAKERGFRAMQFNFVVSTNERAVGLWQSMGFSIVGTLPGAFHHPTMGFVDVFVMFREL